MNTKIGSEEFTKEEIENNHNLYLKRVLEYKKFGMNQILLRESIVRQIDEGSSSILEIGTGKGHLTAMLARSFDRIVSVDNDNTDLRAARLNSASNDVLHKIEFITADAGGLIFPDRSFHAVVSSFTFHHFELPFKVIREMARLADNQIIISDFTGKGFYAVEQVHKKEGKKHSIKSSDFDIVGVYLKELGFDVRVIEDEWQTIYSARRR